MAMIEIPSASLHTPCSQAPNFTLGILGDLHLSPDRQMRLFEEAKDQLVTVLESQQAKLGGGTACQAGLIQLGDVGGYHHQPGSLACFQRCRDWLAGFDLPVALITGNHDLGECPLVEHAA